MISSGDGDPGNTDATHTGTLQLNQTRVTANTEAEAIGAAVSGSITVNVGTEFSTDTFGLGSGSAFRVETDEGISVVEFEDLVGISGSTPDWDYDDRTWTFDVTEAPAEAIIYEKDYPLFDDSPGPVLHATVHVTVTANNPAYPDQFVWNYHLSNIDALYPGGYGIEAFSLPIPDDLIPQNLTNTMGWDTFVTHSALYSPSNGILWTGGTETGPWLMPNGSADFTFTTEPRTIVTGDSEIWSIGFGYGGGGGGAVAKPGEKVSVDLDIGGTYDNGKTFTEATEDSIGGLVVRRAEDNNAPRREIILRKVMDPNHPDVAWDGSVQLDRLNKKLKVFTAATDGTEITFNGTDNVFNNSNLPLSLWVQGDIGSLVMRDSIMRLSPIIGNAATKEGSDSVSFTVFWVSVSLKFDGSVSSDNSAKENWKSYTKDGKGDLLIRS